MDPEAAHLLDEAFGAFSSWGMSPTDIRRDTSRSRQDTAKDSALLYPEYVRNLQTGPYVNWFSLTLDSPSRQAKATLSALGTIFERFRFLLADDVSVTSSIVMQQFVLDRLAQTGSCTVLALSISRSR